MASGIGTVEVKKGRGGLILQGLGKTPRGQNFIRQVKALDVQSSRDPALKAHLKTAVAEMFAQPPLPL